MKQFVVWYQPLEVCDSDLIKDDLKHVSMDNLILNPLLLKSARSTCNNPQYFTNRKCLLVCYWYAIVLCQNTEPQAPEDKIQDVSSKTNPHTISIWTSGLCPIIVSSLIVKIPRFSLNAIESSKSIYNSTLLSTEHV